MLLKFREPHIRGLGLIERLKPIFERGTRRRCRHDLHLQPRKSITFVTDFVVYHRNEIQGPPGSSLPAINTAGPCSFSFDCSIALR